MTGAINSQYESLLAEVLAQGVKKADRTGGRLEESRCCPLGGSGSTGIHWNHRPATDRCYQYGVR